MKNIHRLFAAACLAFAGIVGCAAQGTTDSSTDIIASETEVNVVRYTAEDMAALQRGEMLRIDLAAPDTVYIIEFADPSALGHVLVVNGEDEYVLRDRVPASADFQADTLNRVVLAGDPELAADYAVPPSGGKGDHTSEKPPVEGGLCCDSCSLSGGVLICTGCVPC